MRTRRRLSRYYWETFLVFLLFESHSRAFLFKDSRPKTPRIPESSNQFRTADGALKLSGADDDDYAELPSKRNRRNNVARPKRPKAVSQQIEQRREEARRRHEEALKDPTLLTKVDFADRDDLHPSTKRALTERMGLHSMTEVQLKTYAAALEGKSVRAQARTGTGKTLAFLIPTVERLMLGDKDLYRPGLTVGALIVAPTRELAIQIADEAKKLVAFHDLSVMVVYGGTKIQRDTTLMSKQIPSVLVATPGRLLDHIEKTRIRGRRFSDILSETKIVTLDETDRLLDMGFQKDIKKILSYLPRPEKRQTFLFSATMPSRLRTMMQDIMGNNCLEVDCVSGDSQDQKTNARVEQSYMILDSMDDYISTLVGLLSRIIKDSSEYKVVVFFPAAKLVRFFVNFFKDGLGIHVIELHSRMSQSTRQRASAEFRDKPRSILFTSDVSARGVDYPGVTHVIQYGYPDGIDTYIHRLGRTARAGLSGTGLVVLLPFEKPRLTGLRQNGVREVETWQWHKEVDTATAEKVRAVTHRIRSGDPTLTGSAEGAYKAFLAHYVTRAEALGVSNKQMVQYAREFSVASGLQSTPAFSKKVASRLGIAQIDRFIIEDDYE